jgi:hypothetical protein
LSKGCAAYLYCPPDKEYDFEMMTELLLASSFGETPLEELYADGWTSIPNGLNELIADADKYEGVVLLTLEGVTSSDLRNLVDKCGVICSLTDIGWAHKHTENNFKALCAALEAKEYYGKLRSMKIKAGMKKTDKHVGQVPFGHRRDEEGKLQEIPEMMTIANAVKKHYIAGVPVTDIARSSKGLLSIRQVYGLMEYWSVKRG